MPGVSRPASRFYEFFAGGGMARLGLRPDRWRCAFSNEWSQKKAQSYQANFAPAEELHVADIRSLQTADLPDRADLAWASFPCQDLSLAGAGAGLRGERSGTFFAFYDLMRALAAEDRRVPALVIENVVGLLSLRGGADFAELARLLGEAGYRTGALVVDAALFLPQSRPRLFVIAVDRAASIPPELLCAGPEGAFHGRALLQACAALDEASARDWIWWNLPLPQTPPLSLADMLDGPQQVLHSAWQEESATQRLLQQMSPVNQSKLAAARDGRV